MSLKHQVNRRSFISSSTAALTVALSGTNAWSQGKANLGKAFEVCGLAMPKTEAPQPDAAISLRRLSEQLERSAKKRTSDRKAKREWDNAGQMFGLKEIHGFLPDSQNDDIILVGRSGGSGGKLHLEDLAVALRSAMGKYYTIQDGKKVHYAASVSLDPIPRLWSQMKNSDKRASEAFCNSRNYSRVHGMPFNSRCAKLLLDADAKMKRVMWGLEPSRINNPFPSIYELRKKREKLAGAADALAVQSGMRYWFAPALFSYKSDASSGAVLFEQQLVALNSVGQSQDMTSSFDTADVDPDSRFVTCAWTARMNEFYKADPIWADMYAIYTYFALSRILVTSGELAAKRHRLRFLLEDYPIPYVRTPKYYDSISRENRKVCGGVSMSFNKDTFQASTKTLDGEVARHVKKSRPSGNARIWRL